MPAPRKWTEEEVQFIKDNYSNMTGDKISEQLEIPLTTLRRKIKELGLNNKHKTAEVGDKINRLTILEKKLVQYNGQQKTIAICMCDCGNLTKPTLSSIISEKIKSCGCWKAEKARERISKSNYKHGKGNYQNKLYRVWSSMKNRCNNKNNPEYKNYGGRGITVCELWQRDFESFEEWAINNGYADGLTLDRINVNGNYEPNNCRWATRKVQAINKRNNRMDTITMTAFGETKSVRLWLEDDRCNVEHRGTLFYRLGCGWSHEKALTQKSERS